MMIAELDGSFFYLCIGCKDSHCSFHGNGFTGTGLTYDGNCLAFVKVNVDDNPEIAQQYGIMSIPTMIGFKNGEKVASSLGFMPREELEAVVKQTL